MADDIVTRLRDTAYETEVCWEAAAEIERLRAEINDLRLQVVTLTIPKQPDRYTFIEWSADDDYNQNT